MSVSLLFGERRKSVQVGFPGLVVEWNSSSSFFSPHLCNKAGGEIENWEKLIVF
jgi:hypothetical protein